MNATPEKTVDEIRRALASAWSDVHALLDEVDRLRFIVRAQA